MMELQQAALDVRTREHYREVDDANRNRWLRPNPRRAEPRMALQSVLGTVRLHLVPSTLVDRESGLSGRLDVSVIGDSVLGTA